MLAGFALDDYIAEFCLHLQARFQKQDLNKTYRKTGRHFKQRYLNN